MPEVKPTGKHAFLLRGFARPYVKEALAAVEAIQTLAPFRHMVTPGRPIR